MARVARRLARTPAWLSLRARRAYVFTLYEAGADSVCQLACIGVAIDDETRTAIDPHVTKR
jgi:stage V sporulation protein SpoVS